MFANLKDLQDVTRDKWQDVKPARIRKMTAVEKVPSISDKEKWRNYSAHFLLIS